MKRQVELDRLTRALQYGIYGRAYWTYSTKIIYQSVILNESAVVKLGAVA